MHKQWIPGHFSLLPRGLGTRLTHLLSKGKTCSLTVEQCTQGCSHTVVLEVVKASKREGKSIAYALA